MRRTAAMVVVMVAFGFSASFAQASAPASTSPPEQPPVAAATPAATAAPPAAAPSPCPDQEAALTRIATLLERRPEDATLHFFQAGTYGACGDAAKAAAALERVERFGDGFLPIREGGFAVVWDAPAMQARIAALAARLPRVVDAEVAFRSTRRDLIPEGIAIDAKTRRLFLGSIARGEILALDEKGGERVFASAPQGLQVLGLAVDAGRRRLYAVVTNALVAPETAQNAVLELDADSGALRRRLDAAGAAQLNDVAVASDGTLYASDSGAGGIWRAAPADQALTRWIEASLPGANGVALAADDRALYVAHSTGIARIEVGGEQAITARLPNDTRETLAAIDGLYRRGDTLIGVQNVTNPGRVIALTLDPTGTQVVAVRTLLSHHHPTLAEPTTGAVDGDRFLLLANSFVSRLPPDMKVREPETVTAPVILSMPIASPPKR